MTTFVLIAILLLLAAISVIVLPLLRKNDAIPNPAVGAAFAAAGVLVFGGGALYAVWSNWNWQAPAEDAVTPENMVSRLARRLEKNPDDLEGWNRLGRSYAVLEQYPLAVRAYQRASELAGGKNAEALVGMGEALILNDQNEINGRGGRFIEQALALDPKSGSALFYGAAVAMRRGDLPLARQRFAGLLELDPPPSADVRPIIEQQIAAIDERLAAAGGAPGPASSADGRTAGPPAGPQGSAPPPQGSDRQAAASGPVPPVKVRVTLSPKLNGESLASYPLFVIVRDPRRAGPPLAVKRLKSTFPQSVELTTGDSMLPDHSFTKGQLVEVVARVSKTGSPTASPGDPVGLAAHTVGQGGVVDIQIEHVSP
jgi:cytochrome c-type biogenesis protein CcmH